MEKKARRLGKKGAISFDLGLTVGKESLQGIEFEEGIATVSSFPRSIGRKKFDGG